MTNLSSPEEVEQFAMGVKSMRLRYDKWLQTVVTRIVTEEVLVPLWNAMRALNYSEKIIDGTDIEAIVKQGRKVVIRIVSKYTVTKDDGTKFDVAKARENGTKDHWIEPIDPTDPNMPSALHWETDAGEDAFSKGHMVSGMTASKVVKRTVRANRTRVKERLRAEFKAWRADILNL